MAPTPTITTESFLRIASISIAAYDYLITLPAEWRVYSSKGPVRFTTSNTLFLLIRYISMITIVISNFGFFYDGFSPEVCLQFYVVPPIFKVLQTMVSQAILGVRTYNISRRSPGTGFFLVVFGLTITGLQWFTNLYARTHVQNLGNCTSGNNPEFLVAWTYYVLSMAFDVVTMGMSTIFLLRSAPDRSKMTDLIKLMLYDGMGYFVILTGVNIFNIIIYRGTDKSVQSSGASFGYTVIWIMSQSLLIRIRQAATDRSRHAVVLAHELTTAKDVADAMRMPFVSKGGDTSNMTMSMSQELDIQVQIERAVTVEYDPTYSYRRETYRTPKVIWDTRPMK